MTAIFAIYDNNNNIIGWSRNLIDAIGTKEYFMRKGYNDLVIKRYNKDDKQYNEVVYKIMHQ